MRSHEEEPDVIVVPSSQPELNLRVAFWGAVRPVTTQELGEQPIVPDVRVPLMHVGCAPERVYPLLHVWSHETPEAQVPLFGQTVPNAPFAGAVRPVTVQGLGEQAIEPALRAPVLHVGWAPDMVYPLLHVWSHETPEAQVPLFGQTVPKAPFVGAVKPVTVQYGVQVIDPGATVPALHVGWFPDILYPVLQLWSHETPAVQVPLFGQTVPKAPFVGAVRPTTAQVLATHVIDPELKVPVVHDGWSPEIMYPSVHVRAQTEPDAKVAPFAHSELIAPFWG